MVLQPGDKFGRYELVSWLGRGGMAETWRARWMGDAGVTKSVLIKKVLPELVSDEALVSMFINEARISASLSHGNIAQVFDFGKVEGQYFLAMELVDGQPLHRVLKRAAKMGLQRLPIPLATYIALEMCRGLHYAHTRTDDKGVPLSIVHRDISPDNVLVSYEGQVKIVDFGIAKARMARDFETEPGVVKGKYLFFSPEQARGREVDARTDVWATGLVLYEMLCGQRPVEGNPAAVMMRMANGEFPSPRQTRAELPMPLDTLVMRALSVDLSRRYDSANAFAEALAGFLNSFAPRFSTMNLAYLVRALFREELAAEGRELAVPRSFIDEMASWRATSPQTVPQRRLPLPTRSPLRSAMEPAAESPTQEEQRARPWGAVLLVALLLAGGGMYLLKSSRSEPHPPEQTPPPLAMAPAEPTEPEAKDLAKDDTRAGATEADIRQIRDLFAQGQLDAAAIHAERCRLATSEHPECLFLLAEIKERMGQAEAAASLYRRFSELYPAHPSAPTANQRREQLAQKPQAQPLPAPEKSASAPSPPPLIPPETVVLNGSGNEWAQRAFDLLNQQKFPEARRAAEACLARQPDNADCHLVLGISAGQLGVIDSAVRSFQRFLQLAPADHPFRALIERQFKSPGGKRP